jgi:hypothetical protein
MQGVIEVEHKEAVEVPADLYDLAQDEPAAVRHDPAIYPVQIAVRDLTIRPMFEGVDQRFNVAGIIYIVIVNISDVFSCGPLQGLVKRKGLAAV